MTLRAKKPRRTGGEAEAQAKSSERWATVRRLLLAFIPPEEGGPPPAVVEARARFSGLVHALIGLLLGSAVGFLVVLVVAAVPEVPALVVGFGLGALLGAGVAVTFASRYPVVRRGGGIAILLSPILVLLSPFLLIWLAAGLLRRTRPSR